MEEEYESLASESEINKQTIEQHQSPSEGTAQFPGSQRETLQSGVHEHRVLKSH